LLQKQGLITLKDGVGLLPTSLDIVNNPKKLKIVEIEAPQLTRALDDRQIALAVINTTFSSQVGLSPTRNGLSSKIKIHPTLIFSPAGLITKTAQGEKSGVSSDEVAAAAASCTKATR
jgi:D-methionine transport system substrate-binding protein